MKAAKKTSIAPALALAPAPPLKLDLGAGKNKAGPEWTAVDIRKFEGVDVVADLTKRWQWKDNSVDEVNASHVVEHFDATERIHFFNELYRVMKPGAKAQIITPHWASMRAYGDLTHKWPPVCEFFYFYLSKEWRDVNAPHNDFYTCNFQIGIGHGLHQEIVHRNQEYQIWALTFCKEAAQDLIASLTASK